MQHSQQQQQQQQQQQSQQQQQQQHGPASSRSKRWDVPPEVSARAAAASDARVDGAEATVSADDAQRRSKKRRRRRESEEEEAPAECRLSPRASDAVADLRPAARRPPLRDPAAERQRAEALAQYMAHLAEIDEAHNLEVAFIKYAELELDVENLAAIAKLTLTALTEPPSGLL